MDGVRAEGEAGVVHGNWFVAAGAHCIMHLELQALLHMQDIGISGGHVSMPERGGSLLASGWYFGSRQQTLKMSGTSPLGNLNSVLRAHKCLGSRLTWQRTLQAGDEGAASQRSRTPRCESLAGEVKHCLPPQDRMQRPHGTMDTETTLGLASVYVSSRSAADEDLSEADA